MELVESISLKSINQTRKEKTGNDKFILEFLESSKLETLTLEDEIKLALQNHGITLDRRKTQIKEFGLTPKDVKDIIEIVYYDDPNDPCDYKLDHLLCGVDIHEGLDEIRDNWVRASRDPDENEFSFVLHDYIWNRLLGRRNLEQIIAKLEFGINTENLGKILPSGIENLLNLLFEALNAEEGTILFIDEPEISLHIDWQAKIVDVMWKLGKLNHIIFTSHSPEIVMANLDNVITIPPRAHDRMISEEQFLSHMRSIWNSRKIKQNYLDSVLERNFLFVEGKLDSLLVSSLNVDNSFTPIAVSYMAYSEKDDDFVVTKTTHKIGGKIRN